MRRIRGSVFAFVLVLGVMTIPGVAAGDPVLVLDPAASFTANQTVSVTGNGFPATTSVLLVECLASGTTSDGCDWSTRVFTAGTDAAGFLPQTTVSLKRILASADGIYDCAVDGCVLVASNITGVFARSTLSFDPTSFPSVPVLDVRPATNLAYSAQVAVTALGVAATGQVATIRTRTTDAAAGSARAMEEIEPVPPQELAQRLAWREPAKGE